MKPITWMWLFCAPLWAQDADRDFTGAWRLKSESRQFGSLPSPPASVLNIRHEGISIHCTNAPGETPEHGCAAYKTDRSEARAEWNGGSINSRAKWEGRSLLINSIVSGSRSYTRMDRWTLSNDRDTLRIRRQIAGRYGEAESTLVYEREAPPGPDRNAVSPPALSASTTRFGRHVFKPAGPANYEYTKLDGLEAPAQKSNNGIVTCLAYEDSARLYVEIGIRSQADRSLTIAPESIMLEQSGRNINRTHALRASEEIHAGALRPFTPTPTGKHPQTGQALYDRASIDLERRRHLELQEQESTFASFLLAVGQSDATVVHPGQERTVLYTFEQRHDRNAPFTVSVRFGDEVLQFTFKD